MKPYIVDIVDRSKVSESVRHKINNDVPNSLDSSIRDTQLIEPHTVKPTVKYLFRDDLKDIKYSTEYIVDEIIQLSDDIKKIIIFDVEKDEIKNTRQYNLQDKEATQISHVEITDSHSRKSNVIHIETVMSTLKGLDKFTDRLGPANSLHMLELFDNRNKQLLDILNYTEK